MPNTPSIMGLHFRYRLWIAEMNSHINILRIFEDYVDEIRSKKNEPAVKSGIETFQQHFLNLRKQIDDLRHEMHLAKMSLAASAKQKLPDKKSISKNTHAELKKVYTAYKKTFEQIKKEFTQFESKWLK
ncbi:MAG: hypothetical protein JST75_03945 [Bacteroidetes bacterium]|nr:hypothetical protein [Bacteroidota bacterium]